ncbi:metallophosphoesterase, partial [Candidatus Parcubacteria bacterium]|nr:metallophosphoesterase [Candidatus Parcubacteria bacterium]
NKIFQAYSCCSNNFFDNYYPSGGNYWVDYKGTDSNYGPNQDQPGSDGIGDQPFCFAEKVCDKYPLMKENGWILPKVLISEVYYNVAQDKGKEGENEWIIIHNLEEKEIEIFGWQICDNEKCDFLPDTLLPANNFAIITPTSTTFNSWKIPASMIKIVLNSKFGSHGLANDGDRVILKDANGRIVDAISYGKDTTIFNPSCPNVAEGKSLLRFPQDKDTDTFEDFIEADPTILNKPPIPVIQFSPKNPVKGTKVKFDASPSTDPNGEILNFEWQIASSTFFGTTTEFTFPENGEYEIKLTVTDDNGTISSTSTTIKVEPFSFAIITDLHIGRQYQKDYQGEEYYLTQRLRNVVSWINQHKDDVLCGNEKCKIKFLTVLGDITDNTSLSGFCKGKEILDQLEIPYIPVFGNHDVGTEEEYEQFSKWKGQDYFDQVFWSTSSIPCPNATSTKNFETLLREFNFERDEQNKDYKNFSFSFGGFSFIGLDFVSREKFMKFGSGVGSDAVLNEINKNWLEKKLEEFRENPLILFAHHPLRKNPIDSFSPNELSILEEIADNYFIPFQLGGHIHSFEDWFLGKLPSVANANIIYNDLQKIAVLTTESLMVGSNGRGVEEETAENGVKNGRKGIVRIVQVLGDDKVKPNNWETTINPENIRTEFVAFNPKITEIEYKKFCDSTACMEFESDFFTEKPFTGCWKIGNSSIFCGDNINFQIPEGKIKCSGSQKELNCEFSEAPTTTTITLFAGFGSFFEQISKTIKIELNKFPKLIKISKEKIGQIIMKSYTTGRDLIEKGRSFKDKVIAFVKHSPEIPVAIFEVDFEKAKDDIDLSTLIIDSNLKTKKAILYMENWPSEAERSKILFLPK